jgi:hypothetical protein
MEIRRAPTHISAETSPLVDWAVMLIAKITGLKPAADGQAIFFT